MRTTTHYLSEYGLWLRLAATDCNQLRTAKHRAKFARVQQLRPRCTVRPSAFPKLNVAGSNPVARSSPSRGRRDLRRPLQSREPGAVARGGNVAVNRGEAGAGYCRVATVRHRPDSSSGSSSSVAIHSSADRGCTDPRDPRGLLTAPLARTEARHAGLDRIPPSQVGWIATTLATDLPLDPSLFVDQAPASV